MEELDEWQFEFQVSAPNPISQDDVLDLLDQGSLWAEARRLGIGGGCRPASTFLDGAARSWHFGFGLHRTEYGQLIPNEQARELWGVLQAECERRGYEYSGGFRAFEPDKSDEP